MKFDARGRWISPAQERTGLPAPAPDVGAPDVVAPDVVAPDVVAPTPRVCRFCAAPRKRSQTTICNACRARLAEYRAKVGGVFATRARSMLPGPRTREALALEAAAIPPYHGTEALHGDSED